MSFQNKNIVICGGASGIGLASAELFLEKGANVLIIDIKKPLNPIFIEYDSSKKNKSIYCLLDLSQKTSKKNLKKYLKEIFEKNIDILVNSIGIQTYGTVDNTPYKIWKKTIDTNLFSLIYASQVCLKYMIKNKSGSIVNVSSIQATRCRPNASAYISMKGAISALTRTMALDYAKYGIRVNAVEPAAIETPLLEVAASEAKIEKNQAFKLWGKQHPMGRIGTAKEVAYAIIFLASDKASFITGISLPVDGGVNASAFNI